MIHTRGFLKIMDHLISLLIQSPDEMALTLAERARDLRLAKNLSQQGLADRAGVPLGTLKRFERTGQIALVSLIRIAVALDAAEPLQAWFQRPAFQTLDEALAATQPRQRGRAR